MNKREKKCRECAMYEQCEYLDDINARDLPRIYMEKDFDKNGTLKCFLKEQTTFNIDIGFSEFS